MLIYFSVFSAVLFSVLTIEVYSGRLKESARAFLFTIFALPLLSLLSGLRYNVGVDFQEYERIFELVRTSDFNSAPLINLLVKFFSYFTESNLPIFLVLSISTTYLFLNFIFKYSKDHFVSLLLFLCFGGFYLASFNHVRQLLAVSIFLFSIRFILDRKFTKYLICICLASLAHYSALLLLPFFYIVKLKFSFRSVVLILLFYVVALGSAELFIQMSPYAVYLERVVVNERNFLLTSLFILVSFSFVLWGIYRTKKLRGGSKESIFYYMSLVSGMFLISSIFSTLPWNLFFRVNGYFLPYLLILSTYISVLLKSFNVFYYLIFRLAFFVLCYSYLYITLLTKGDMYMLLPYKTYWGVIF